MADVQYTVSLAEPGHERRMPVLPNFDGDSTRQEIQLTPVRRLHDDIVVMWICPPPSNCLAEVP
jgi:hypothetical protein